MDKSYNKFIARPVMVTSYIYCNRISVCLYRIHVILGTESTLDFYCRTFHSSLLYIHSMYYSSTNKLAGNNCFKYFSF